MMRYKGMHDWHLSESGKIPDNNMTYVKFVKADGIKNNAKNMDINPKSLRKRVVLIRDTIRYP